VQNALKPFFGIDGCPGVYPFWIYFETRDAAKHNGLATSISQSSRASVPLPPVLLFSIRTRSEKCLVPDMNLKFRTVGELLDDLDVVMEKGPLYTSYDGALTFTSSQVQPCSHANPDQMCVKKGTPRYGGTYCKTIPGEDAGNTSNNPVTKALMGKAKWALKILKPILNNLKLDIGHQTTPPDHTLLLYDFLDLKDQKFHQTAEAKIEGPGLAAWDVEAGPFRTKLISEEFDQLPLLKNLIGQCPGGLDKLGTNGVDFSKGGGLASSFP